MAEEDIQMRRKK